MAENLDPAAAVLDMIDGMPTIIFWCTDANGIIQQSVGGALRAIGLTRGATVGNHVSLYGYGNEAMYDAAMRGLSGIERQNGSWGPATRRHYITAWCPYYTDGKIGGVVVLAMDVSGLAQSSLEDIQDQLSDFLPVATRLAEAEADKLSALAGLAKAQANTAERSWSALIHGVKWLAPKLATPLTMIATAGALWVADRLGMLDHITRWFVTPTP